MKPPRKTGERTGRKAIFSRIRPTNFLATIIAIKVSDTCRKTTNFYEFLMKSNKLYMFRQLLWLTCPKLYI